MNFPWDESPPLYCVSKNATLLSWNKTKFFPCILTSPDTVLSEPANESWRWSSSSGWPALPWPSHPTWSASAPPPKSTPVSSPTTSPTSSSPRFSPSTCRSPPCASSTGKYSSQPSSAFAKRPSTTTTTTSTTTPRQPTYAQKRYQQVLRATLTVSFILNEV